MRIKKIFISLTIIFLILFFVLRMYTYSNTPKQEKTKLKFENDCYAIQNEDIIKSSMVDKFITKEQDTIQLSYEKTKNNKDIYISSENDEYIYMNDVLVGYIKDINIDTINNIPMESETAKIIAENFLNDNINDFEKYEFISNNYIEAYAEYSVIFMNKLNGFNTNDIIRVNINNSGIVVSFSRFHYNEFEKYNNIVFNMENIENMVINEIKEKYGNSYVNSEIKYSFLNLVNKKLVLQIEVNVELNQGGIPIQTTEIVFYEL